MRPEIKGRVYRKAADTVTYGRTALGAIIAVNTLSGDRLLPRALRHRSVGAAATVAMLGAMDKFDGVLARKAEANGVPITREDKEKDPREDKRFNRLIMGALVVRELVSSVHNRDSKRALFAGTLALSLYQTEDRNERMELSRKQAVEGADTGAVWLNKWKTGVQNVGHTLAVSPLALSGVGQTVTSAFYIASNFMGEIGLSIADRIHRGEANNTIAPIYQDFTPQLADSSYSPN